MKAFTHGSIRNFQESAREMFVADIAQMICGYQQDDEKLLVGSIDLHKEEIAVFGRLNRIFWDEVGENTCGLDIQLTDGEKKCIVHELNQLVMSHDAVFDIIDEAYGEVCYQVIYLTFQVDQDALITYFLAQEEEVSEPLACVTEFWQHVHGIGKDANFTTVGCRMKAFCQ